MTNGTESNTPNSSSTASGVSAAPQNQGWKWFGISVIVIAIVLLAFWLIKTFIFPSEFTPVTLSAKETQVLNQKLDRFNLPVLPAPEAKSSSATTPTSKPALTPEPYSEVDAKREVTFTEREINAMIAHNTDMADKLAIDLSDNLASAKLLFPLDPDMPLFGGKTLRINAGIELGFRNNQPIVKLRGVSAWGVPVPNAWLGDLKNVDLVNEFGGSGGFWEDFAAGIDFMQVSEGKLVVKLKE